MSISGTRFSLALSLSSLLSMGASGALAQDESPQTWHVANNGVDGPTCGARASPCRSIGQGIAKARAGDFVLVGPGIYGELDGDGEPGGVGEERDCGATVCLDLAVRLLSREGAERTLINVPGVTGFGVTIKADGAKFGMPNHGFTVFGASTSAIRVRAAGVWVIDNIVRDSNTGIRLDSAGTDPGEHAANGCLVIGNRARANSIGFAVRGDNNYLELNVAADSSDFGFQISGNGNRLHNNAAMGNGGEGVTIVGSNHRLTRNALIANGIGLSVLPQATGLVVRENNLFGNLVRRFPPGPPNLALFNTSGSSVRATNNFWGSATGPGPDPADEILTDSVSETQVVPFATQPFEIRFER